MTAESKDRNPAWSRDELILALDLFLRRRHPSVPGPRDPEVIALSETLNVLAALDAREDRHATFRNPNGVSMKLANFLRLDPSYRGAGLSRGNQLEERVWQQFAADFDSVPRVATAIRAGLQRAEARCGPSSDTEAAEEEAFPEGRVLYRLHRARERNGRLVERAKAARRPLACEVCGFDFEAVYGARGSGFIEAHHRVPIAHLEPAARTRLQDLALVCANCHRMLHREPFATVEALAETVRGRG